MRRRAGHEDSHCGRRPVRLQRSYAPDVMFAGAAAVTARRSRSCGCTVGAVRVSRPVAWARLAAHALRGAYVGWRALARDGFLAGSDARRLDEMCAAVADPDAKASVVARGGYGAMRDIEGVRGERMQEKPKWIVGFSDVTALHAMAGRRSLASVHGPNVIGLGFGSSAERSGGVDCGASSVPRALRTWRGLRSRGPGGRAGPSLAAICRC